MRHAASPGVSQAALLTGITLPCPMCAELRNRGCALPKLANLYRSLVALTRIIHLPGSTAKRPRSDGRRRRRRGPRKRCGTCVEPVRAHVRITATTTERNGTSRKAPQSPASTPTCSMRSMSGRSAAEKRHQRQPVAGPHLPVRTTAVEPDALGRLVPEPAGRRARPRDNDKLPEGFAGLDGGGDDGVPA